jgi:hypothetical protein
MAKEDQWLDEEAGPVVRPYALTRGRTRPTGEALDLIALVTAVRGVEVNPMGLDPEHLALLRMCRLPASVDFFERRRVPFAVAVNCFEGALRHHPEDVRSALDLDPDVPVLLCDARQRSSARDVLVALIEHAVRGLQRARAAGTNV